MERIETKRILILVILLAALCAYAWTLRLKEPTRPRMPSLDLIPREVGDYTARDQYIPPESLRELGADTTLARSYISPSGETIEMFLGWFADQQENSQIHSPKHCYPGSGWDIIREGSVNLNIGGSVWAAKQLIISGGKERRMIVYWFNMQDRIIANEFALKYNQMLSTLLSRPPAASFIRFSTNLPAAEEARTAEGLIRFIETISPDIMDAITAHGDLEPEG
jgi:EpsI family protein